MTAKRYLPASLACLVALSAGSAGYANGGGSALDPYSYVPAPTSQKYKKDDKGKKQRGGTIPLMKKVQAEESSPSELNPNQSQTFVKEANAKSGKKAKEVTFAPTAAPKHKKVAPTPVQTTTRVSDLAPPTPAAPSKAPSKAPAVSAQHDESVMGGIKTIGEGYSKTFKAATHGMFAGSKKMTDGIKSGAKASGDMFKHGAGVVGHGFKATGGKIKDGAGTVTDKLAKSPAPAPAPEKPKAKEKAPEAKVAASTKKETPIGEEIGDKKEGLGSKLAHFSKPKMPKLSIPFMGGSKKKAPAADPQAGANELGAPEASVAATPAPTPKAAPAPKPTPIVDTPVQTAQAPKAKKDKDKVEKSSGGIASMPGNAVKKMGKLWPFGKKDDHASDVAGKQTPAPL